MVTKDPRPAPQYEQLPMFMSAREIRSTHTAHPGDITSNDKANTMGTGGDPRNAQDNTDTLMKRKVKESKENGLPAHDASEYGNTADLGTLGRRFVKNQTTAKPSTHDSIKAEGVKNPVNLYLGGESGERTLGNGHHRVAAALDIAPDRLMPVLHHDDQWAAIKSDGYTTPMSPQKMREQREADANYKWGSPKTINRNVS